MKSHLLLLLNLCCHLFIVVDANENRAFNDGERNDETTDPKAVEPNEMSNLHFENGSSSFQFLEFDWHRVSTPYIAAFWILLASIARISFQKWKKLCDIFPDSALLIMVGLIIGFVLYKLDFEPSIYSLDSQVFFLYLLPPIVFGAGYFMPNRTFFDNLGSIFVFTFVGTVWSAFTI
uniref:Cation/H+ exchanger domain-containing protein n=1 Tax=Plectus sambesii TaxID=2011161 RepID=A0A914WCD0_9BILA